MLRLILVLSFIAVEFVGFSWADESCPIKLQESQTQSLIIAQGRDSLEQRLAQAIRANHELSAVHDADQAELKKVRDELASLKPEKKDEKK